MKAYQIRISLEAVEPKVWRQAVIPAGITFSRLSAILNDVMGWIGGHLFSVTAPDGYYVSGIPECEEMEVIPDFFRDKLSGGSDAIDSVFTSHKNLSYVYDLGDSWEHLIQVEAVLDDYPHTYPQVLDGDGDCPPEDIGGPYAYMNIMEHPQEYGEEYEDFLDEMEPFDLEETNCYLEEVYGGYDKENRQQNSGSSIPFAAYDEDDFTDLEESLLDYRVEDLKCICRELGIQGYSGLRKQQIVDLLLLGIADKEVLSGALLDMDDEQMDFFESLFDAPCFFLDLTEEAIRIADEFLRRGLVFQTFSGTYFVPEEVQQAYRSIDRETLSKRRRRVQLILSYCRAAVNLYGIVETGHLLKIFHQQNEGSLGYSELFDVLKLADRQEGCPINWKEGYLYDSEIDLEIFDILLEQQEEKPYYVPPKEEFLKYQDFYYCEKPLAWKAMEHFFESDMGLDPFKAELLCHELEMLVHVGASMDVLMELLEAFDMPEPSDTQIIKLTQLLMEAWNCTRMVINRGFTPNELRGMEEGEELPDNVIPFPVRN
ncbi:MAG: hypothetical protein HFE76_12520 [Firmicutes bacterium]|nr:hypothetical protein [Bacillota bacterium]